jgi:hypothetical protein
MILTSPKIARASLLPVRLPPRLCYYLEFLLSLFNSYIYISIGVGEGGKEARWKERSGKQL